VSRSWNVTSENRNWRNAGPVRHGSINSYCCITPPLPHIHAHTYTIGFGLIGLSFHSCIHHRLGEIPQWSQGVVRAILLQASLMLNTFTTLFVQDVKKLKCDVWKQKLEKCWPSKILKYKQLLLRYPKGYSRLVRVNLKIPQIRTFGDSWCEWDFALYVTKPTVSSHWRDEYKAQKNNEK